MAEDAVHSTDTEVRNEYFKTAEIVDAWAAEARKGEPEKFPGFLVFTSMQPKHKEKAQEMWPQVENHLRQLKALMRKHLDEARRG